MRRYQTPGITRSKVIRDRLKNRKAGKSINSMLVEYVVLTKKDTYFLSKYKVSSCSCYVLNTYLLLGYRLVYNDLDQDFEPETEQ